MRILKYGPSMHLESHEEIKPGKPRTGKWIWGGILLLFATAVAMLFLVDGKLEPYDDLKLEPLPQGDATSNGLLFLKGRWIKRPNTVIAPADQKRLKAMAAGTEPLDEDFVMTLTKDRKNAREEFSQALVMPYWRDSDSALFKANLLTDLPLLFRLEAAIALRSGDAGLSRRLNREMTLLARRQLEGGESPLSMLFVGVFQHAAADYCCEVLVSMAHDPAAAREMEAAWSVDPPLAAAVGAAVRYNTMNLAEAIQENQHHSFTTHYQKPNQTVNLMNSLTRKLMFSMFKPFPSREAAMAAGLRSGFTMDKPGPWKYLDPNFEGKRLALASVERSGAFILDQYKVLFLSRAMRVRLAVHWWRQAHPGQWPATLAEPVPDYLTEMPRDPWNGAPLIWDQTTATVYAVGADWIADPPVFPANGRGWIASDTNAPGLRMELPPRPVPHNP